jgi:hypothetical protein
MNELLKQYLENTASPEFLEMIMRAHSLMDVFELPDYSMPFDELVMVADTIDLTTLNESVANLTRQGLVYILREHSVIPLDSASIPMLCDMLDAIKGVETTEANEELLQELSQAESSEDAFCALIQVVTGRDGVAYISHLESVHASLIAKVIELATAQLNPVQDNANVDGKPYVTKVRAFAQFINLVILRLTSDGTPVGMPFSQYLPAMQAMVGNIEEDNLSKSLVAIAQELLGCAYASCDGSENPRTVIRPILEDLSLSINDMTTVDIEVERLLLEFNRQQTTGTTKVM